MVALTGRRATWVCVVSAFLSAHWVALCEDVPNPERGKTESVETSGNQLVPGAGNLPESADSESQVDAIEIHEDSRVEEARADQPESLSLGVPFPEIVKAVASLEGIKESMSETEVSQMLKKVGIDALQDPASAASNGQFDDEETRFLNLLAAADSRKVANTHGLAKSAGPFENTEAGDGGAAPRAARGGPPEETKSGAAASARQRLHSRRLQILGIPQLRVPNPFAGLGGMFRSSLSARDRDQLESFERHVQNSRERVYRDLVFVTGAKQHGIDEYDMKQLVSKVGLESLAHPPLQQSLTAGEAAVVAAARRSRFQVERIIATYDREVAQHAKALEKNLGADIKASDIHSRVTAIASDGLFSKRRPVAVRRLGAVADLIQGPGLLGSAGSLLRAIDPASMSESLSTTLGGLGLHHVHLPNLGGPQRGSGGPLLPSLPGNALQNALEGVFNGPQRAAALAGPLRAFQQGVATATDGTIGAFLSNEGLDRVLDVRHAKQLLGGLIGGDSVGPRGVTGWHDVGLHREAADQLSRIMPFDAFLGKLRALAHDVDAEVGALREDTERRIRTQGVHLLPGDRLRLNEVMDRLVWGTFQTPARRLQQLEAAAQPERDAPQQRDADQQQQQRKAQQKPEHHWRDDQRPDERDEGPQLQQAEQPDSEQQQEQQEGEDPAEAAPADPPQQQQQQQAEAGEEGADDADLLFDLEDEEGIDDQQEELELALLKVELLSEAVNVLLAEYEKAVQELQQQLQLQIETADELRLFIAEDAESWKGEVAAALPGLSQRRLQALPEQQQQQPQQPQQQRPGLGAASQEAAEALDGAVQGLRDSVQSILRGHSELSRAGQAQLEALAAKVQAVAEERLPPLLPAVAA